MGKVVKFADRPYHGIYNMDESKVPPYEVPSPLRRSDGKIIENAAEWFTLRRPELMNLFSKEMFGWMPPRPDQMRFDVLTEKKDALDGIATRKEIRITCRMNNGQSKSFDMLLYYPNKAKKPVPCFLCLNGRGNHTVTCETDLRITEEPVVNWATHEVFATEAPDPSTRGAMEESMNMRGLVENGFAGATVCISEIFYDSPEAYPSSIYKLFLPQEELMGDRHPFGAIGAWAWGLSRAQDCLENEPAVDGSRVAVHGFSRLGKTALWAGACDPRFAMVISSESGCGGASLARRQFGESIDYLLFWRTYWFCENYRKYRNNEKNMPFDQNMLIALAAPRPVHVASAWGDLHSDPKGEYISTVSAKEVYQLLGSDCSALKEEMPPVNTLTGNEISYHIRDGNHDVTYADWKCYLELGNRYLKV